MDKSKLGYAKLIFSIALIMVLCDVGFSVSTPTNYTFQIFINNASNITTPINYSIKIIDSTNGFVILDNATGSIREYTDENGTITLDNSSLELYKHYLLIVYDDNDTIILKKAIYFSGYVPIWIEEGESDYFINYKDMLEHALKMPILASILFVSLVLMFIKLFRLGIGLIASGTVLLGFTALIWDILDDSQKWIIVIIGVILTVIGSFLMSFAVQNKKSRK